MNDPQMEEIIRQLKWLNGQLRGIGLILFLLLAPVVVLLVVGLRMRA